MTYMLHMLKLSIYKYTNIHTVVYMVGSIYTLTRYIRYLLTIPIYFIAPRIEEMRQKELLYVRFQRPEERVAAPERCEESPERCGDEPREVAKPSRIVATVAKMGEDRSRELIF